MSSGWDHETHRGGEEWEARPPAAKDIETGQLGYWVGYRIAKAFYQRATDKRAAIREMIQMTDPRAFLAKSVWYPGIVLGLDEANLPGW